MSWKEDEIELIETWQQLLGVIEEARDEGAVIFLKWDGERERVKHTVLLSNPVLEIEQSRHDSNDMLESVKNVLQQYARKGGLS